MCDLLSSVTYCLQQQSLKKAAEVAAGEVVQNAQDYVAAESAALRSKQAKGKSMDALSSQGELCRTEACDMYPVNSSAYCQAEHNCCLAGVP